MTTVPTDFGYFQQLPYYQGEEFYDPLRTDDPPWTDDPPCTHITWVIQFLTGTQCTVCIINSTLCTSHWVSWCYPHTECHHRTEPELASSCQDWHRTCQSQNTCRCSHRNLSLLCAVTDSHPVINNQTTFNQWTVCI